MTVKLIGSTVRYLCLSSDTKPTRTAGDSVPVGSTLIETDTLNVFIAYDGDNWAKYKRNSDTDRAANIKGTYKPNETHSYMGG